MSEANRVWIAAARERKQEARRAERVMLRQDVRDEICRRVMLGASLMTVCTEDKNMPSYSTVLDWLHKDEAFNAAYQRATRLRAEAMFEDALEIADDARNDWMEKHDPNNPGWILNGEHIQRSKLRVETRKWAAAKLNPARFGDKVAVEGNPDQPVVAAITHRVVHVVSHETLAPTKEEKQIDGWGDDEY